MPKKGSLVIGLLSHYFEDENLGCVALSISNIMLLDQVAERIGLPIEYRVLVNEKHPEVPLGFTSSAYSYARYSSSKQSVKHPLRLFRTRIFDDCDLVMNINAGDGFTDLYGFPRMLSESYMSMLAQMKKQRTIVAPQTIGPFHRRTSRILARSILRRSARVFSRDKQSTELSRSLGVSENSLSECIDVAFALPYTRPDLDPARVTRVGVNVSGLLYRGGYDGKNYFNLAFDYKTFIERLVERLLDAGVEVHLIAHVTSRPDAVEDDYSACEQVARSQPRAVLAPKFDGPIEAKSYISGMDFFTGGRMHSTIAALSSGVPVVPIGYSKKLGGLFDTLEYPYYIDARADWGIEEAISQLEDWLNQLDKLRAGVEHAASIYEARLEQYRVEIQGIFEDALTRA